MAKAKKPRRFTVIVDDADVNLSWRNASITLRQLTGGVIKEAVIKLERPSDVSYIREQLDKVVAGWASDLACVTSKPGTDAT